MLDEMIKDRNFLLILNRGADKYSLKEFNFLMNHFQLWNNIYKYYIINTYIHFSIIGMKN